MLMQAPFNTGDLPGLSLLRGNINRMVFTLPGFGPQPSPFRFGGLACPGATGDN
jgi:hypothetical protein